MENVNDMKALHAKIVLLIRDFIDANQDDQNAVEEMSNLLAYLGLWFKYSKDTKDIENGVS